MDSEKLLQLLSPAPELLSLLDDRRLPETWKRRADFPPAAVALAEFIDGEPDLESFRGGHFALGGMGLNVSPYMVGSWLIQQAAMLSAPQAIEDLPEVPDCNILALQAPYDPDRDNVPPTI